ncbi:hypothetical protein F4808DRAFT_457273 [Astrocystis sublimbata]|nr:hypothetical protein F4808DRAFT_457273 [Astrocystis sublimbata]
MDAFHMDDLSFLSFPHDGWVSSPSDPDVTPIDSPAGSSSVSRGSTTADQTRFNNSHIAYASGHNHTNTAAPLNTATSCRQIYLPQPSFGDCGNGLVYGLPMDTHHGSESYLGLPNSMENVTLHQPNNHRNGVSPRYLGNANLPANQPANIPDEKNTSVWITGLPPDVDHKTLLGCVRDCGKVYATVINPPRDNHMTAASKIVFFDVAGAQSLLKQARLGSFIVGRHQPRVILNRIKTAAQPSGCQSRVLHISGPREMVNTNELSTLFRSHHIVWQDEEVNVIYDNGNHTQLEWRFGSYRCQADLCRRVIQKDMSRQGVRVDYGVDPFEPLAPEPSTNVYAQQPQSTHEYAAPSSTPYQTYLPALQTRPSFVPQTRTSFGSQALPPHVSQAFGY